MSFLHIVYDNKLLLATSNTSKSYPYCVLCVVHCGSSTFFANRGPCLELNLPGDADLSGWPRAGGESLRVVTCRTV